MAKKQKYYVIWAGHQTGIFDSWSETEKHIKGYAGAQYKAFESKSEAESASKKNYWASVSPASKAKAPRLHVAKFIVPSISVDAACAGNPGKMEYRGVATKTKKQLFIQGPFEQGTNNIGEFLALVHGIALLKSKNKENIPVYSDSKIAMNWVKQKRCKTNMHFDASNRDLLDLIKRAEKWLKENTYKNPILKWETKAWGEIPADFGRK